MSLNSEPRKHVRLAVRLKNISDQDHPRKHIHDQAEKKKPKQWVATVGIFLLPLCKHKLRISRHLNQLYLDSLLLKQN